MTAPDPTPGQALSDEGYTLLAIADDFLAAFDDGDLVDRDEAYDWLVAEARKLTRPAPEPVTASPQPPADLVPVARPDGRVYRPRKAPEALILGYEGDVDGVMVVRTHDVGLARGIALDHLDAEAPREDGVSWAVSDPHLVWGHRRPDGDDGYWAWEASPDGLRGQPAVRFCVKVSAAEPPADTQQGDERLTATTCPRWHRDPDGWCVDERPHLAARPSADTETQETAARRFLARHYRVMASAVNVADWPAYLRLCADAQEDGSAWLDHDALADLRAALDGGHR